MTTNTTTYRKESVDGEIVEDTNSYHLHQVKSSGVMTISPELFEKLYLTPKVATSGDFRKRFANPSPLGFMGFVISGATFSTILLGWGGANSLVGVLGIFYFTGPVLLLFTMICEWVMGNFFPMMVNGMFAVFWLSFGLLETPTLGIAASYSATGNAAEGATSTGYNAAIALYLMIWGFWLVTMWIFSLKTNVVFALLFILAFTAAFVLSAAYWKVSVGDFDMAMKLQKAGGAVFFVTALLAWYITGVIMAAEMRLTLSLPVGDLSHFWPANTDLADMEKNA